jgi:glycosyltransferase involved in cell wall biosynthesis
MRCSAQRIDRLFSQARPWAPPVPDPEATLGLRGILRQERPDIVHGHDWLARSFLPLKRAAGPPLVMSLHYYTLSCPKKTLLYGDGVCSGPALLKCSRCAGEHYGRAKGFGIVLGNLGFSAAELRAVDLFLPVSDATAGGNGLAPGTPRCEVIPNFVLEAPMPSSEEAEFAALLPRDPYLLFVGDLRREKGVDVLLDAYRSIDGAPPLVLISKTAGSPWPLPANVLQLRDWPNRAVRSAQRRCLALVAPSVWAEPWGMVILETLAGGRPVIGSRVGGIPDLIEHRRNGLLVEPGDREALREAIEAIVAEDGLLDSLAQGAASWAHQYRASAIVSRVERAYERVSQTNGRLSAARGPSFRRSGRR